jgi:hypothetical protein
MNREMKSQQQITLTIALALAIGLIGGLIVVPAMVTEQQQVQADKGGVPHAGSHGDNGKHKGHGGIDT